MNTALNPNNYPTYNVGDKVTIRQWDDMESESQNISQRI
jgi:hypothetical protein